MDLIEVFEIFEMFKKFGILEMYGEGRRWEDLWLGRGRWHML